jgi:hypothetical protein
MRRFWTGSIKKHVMSSDYVKMGTSGCLLSRRKLITGV